MGIEQALFGRLSLYIPHQQTTDRYKQPGKVVEKGVEGMRKQVVLLLTTTAAAPLLAAGAALEVVSAKDAGARENATQQEKKGATTTPSSDARASAIAGLSAAWGANSDGQLGDGTTINSKLPVGIRNLSSTDVKAVAGGGHHSLAK